MGQYDRDTASANRHQETWELLPWYVNGTLQHHEREKVEQHLVVCARCAEELVRCQQMAATVQCAENVPTSSASAQFAKLSAKIESLEERHQTQSDQARRPWIDLLALRVWLDRMSWGVRWALAGQAALILLLAGTLVWQVSLPTEATYQTLSSPAAKHPEAVLQMRVIFAADTMEAEIRALLLDTGGRIVDGPSSIGAYAVEVPLPEDSAEHASKLSQTLRTHPKVTLAEPIHTR